MLSSTRQFTDAMENKDIKYEYKGTTDSGKDVVVLRYTCENISTLTLQFFFDEDCKSVAIRMFDLVKFPESKLPTMLAAINQQNARFRFVKFVIDTNDHTVQAEADVAFRSHDVGDICLEYVSGSINICDDAYPELMKASGAERHTDSRRRSGQPFLLRFFAVFSRRRTNSLQVPPGCGISMVGKCVEREVPQETPFQERTGHRLEAGSSGAVVFAREQP